MRRNGFALFHEHGNTDRHELRIRSTPGNDHAFHRCLFDFDRASIGGPSNANSKHAWLKRAGALSWSLRFAER